MAHPPPFIQQPSSPHKTTLIFLHGTSQTGPSLASIILSFPIPIPIPSLPGTTKTLPDLLPSTKFVFPTGSPKPTTVLGGKTTNSWFDIHTFADRTIGEEAGLEGLSESISYLASLIEGEIEELVSSGVERKEAGKRVLVAGFSSGSAVAVLGLLSGVWGSVGGMVGLSGWLPFRRQIEGLIEGLEDGVEVRGAVEGYVRGLLRFENAEKEEMRERGAGGGKVLLCHGVGDLKMRHEWGVEKRLVLERIGMEVEWKSYPELEHWVCGEEMLDVVTFLESVWQGI